MQRTKFIVFKVASFGGNLITNEIFRKNGVVKKKTNGGRTTRSFRVMKNDSFFVKMNKKTTKKINSESFE